MAVKYKPKPFNENDYRNEVETELESGRELTALIMIHSYIEAYFLDWFLISGTFVKETSKKILKDIERLGFVNFLNIHTILGNINKELYEKARSLNESRNKFVHDLPNIEISDKETKESIRKEVEKGLEICNEITSLYKQSMDKKSAKL